MLRKHRGGSKWPEYFVPVLTQVSIPFLITVQNTQLKQLRGIGARSDSWVRGYSPQDYETLAVDVVGFMLMGACAMACSRLRGSGSRELWPGARTVTLKAYSQWPVLINWVLCLQVSTTSSKWHHQLGNKAFNTGFCREILDSSCNRRTHRRDLSNWMNENPWGPVKFECEVNGKCCFGILKTKYLEQITLSYLTNSYLF